ncbi:MAG: restriction endonuclease [Methanobacteriota archaeon]|nr:MAG: restriction endonuclease [Euryarchaeota archaeon]
MGELFLENLNGYEFQELVADIFRKIGYKKVKVGPYSGDGGRDITMVEVKSGEHVPVIVECKHHKSSVGRPVVQKLHSAVLTLGGGGRKKGFIVTSGFFSNAAIEYAKKVNRQSSEITIELIDGRKLKKIAIEAGVDFKSGTIQAMTNESLPFSSRAVMEKYAINEYFDDIKGLDTAILKFDSIDINFKPAFYIHYLVLDGL